jgi:hypothetical protein
MADSYGFGDLEEECVDGNGDRKKLRIHDRE